MAVSIQSSIASLAATLAIYFFVSYGASAGQLDIYEHNGSVINWFVVGDEVTATYDQPKPSLEKSGIKDGSVLFKGFEEGGSRIVGTAYVFRRGCPPAPYNVNGHFSGNEIVLTGPAPVRVNGGCEVVRYSLDSPNARLLFRYSSTHH